MNFSTYVTSLIRTVVPTIIGALIGWIASVSWLASLLDISSISPDNQAKFTATAIGVAISGYYALVRWAEKRWPQIGWLLGKPAAPAYFDPAPKPPTPVYVPAHAPDPVPATPDLATDLSDLALPGPLPTDDLSDLDLPPVADENLPLVG